MLLRPVVGVTVGLIALISNLEWLRDHLLPLSVRQRVQWDAALPQLSWQTWVALTAVALVGLTLEWAFRELRVVADRLADLETLRRPHVLGEAVIALTTGQDMFPSGGSAESRQFSYSHLYLKLTNDTSRPTDESAARDLVATVTYVKPNKGQIKALWASMSADERQSLDDAVTLRVGETRFLTLAMRARNGVTMLVSYLGTNTKEPLGGGPYIVTARVRGPFVDELWRVTFTEAESKTGLKVVSCERLTSDGWAPASASSARA